jgi:hypothetical protein
MSIQSEGKRDYFKNISFVVCDCRFIIKIAKTVLNYGNFEQMKYSSDRRIIRLRRNRNRRHSRIRMNPNQTIPKPGWQRPKAAYRFWSIRNLGI